MRLTYYARLLRLLLKLLPRHRGAELKYAQPDKFLSLKLTSAIATKICHPELDSRHCESMRLWVKPAMTFIIEHAMTETSLIKVVACLIINHYLVLEF